MVPKRRLKGFLREFLLQMALKYFLEVVRQRSKKIKWSSQSGLSKKLIDSGFQTNFG